MHTGTYFYPGPVQVNSSVLDAMTAEIIPHRSAEFEATLAQLQHSLQHIFGSTNPVLFACASGTGMMEAAIRNLPPGRILSINNGAFAKRFADVALSCNRSVDILPLNWGSVPAPELLDETLTAHKRSATGSHAQYVAVTIVHSETSTGALSPLTALAAVARRHNVLLLVDAVSSIGAVELSADDLKADFIFTASQKALALPPGLAFGVASQALLDAAQHAEARGTYFDLRRLHEAAALGRTAFTPPVPLIRAAQLQCALIERETIARRAERHRDMSAALYRWLTDTGQQLALRPLTPQQHASPAVSVITLPPHLDSAHVVNALRNNGYTIATGYGERAHDTIRIGHMGDHTVEELNSCLNALGATLEALTN